MSKSKTTTYLEMRMPGSLFDEEEVVRVPDRCLKDAIKRMQPHHYKFRFYDVKTATVKVDGKEQKWVGKAENFSPWYFLGGKVYTVAELEAEFGGDPRHSILLSNVKGNGYKKAIHCRTGNWQPFEKDDVHVPDPNAKTK